MGKKRARKSETIPLFVVAERTVCSAWRTCFIFVAATFLAKVPADHQNTMVRFMHSVSDLAQSGQGDQAVPGFMRPDFASSMASETYLFHTTPTQGFVKIDLRFRNIGIYVKCVQVG